MISRKVNIIASFETMQLFKKLSKFELDLGKKNLGRAGNNGPTVMEIKDSFVDYVFNNYGFFVNKIGNYGSISFYYTNYSEKNTIYIFYDQTENEIKIPTEVTNIELWLSEQLYNLEEKLKNKTITNGA